MRDRCHIYSLYWASQSRKVSVCDSSLLFEVITSGSAIAFEFEIAIGDADLGEVGFTFYTGTRGTGVSIQDRIQIYYDGNLVGDTLFTGTEPDPPLGTYTYTRYYPTLDPMGNVIIGNPSGTEEVTIDSSSLRSSGTTIGNITYFPEDSWGGGQLTFTRQNLNSNYITIKVYGHPTNTGTGFFLQDFICPNSYTLNNYELVSNVGYSWLSADNVLYDTTSGKSLVGLVHNSGEGYTQHVLEIDNSNKTFEVTPIGSYVKSDDITYPSFIKRSFDDKYIAAYSDHNTNTSVKYKISTNSNDSTSWDTEQIVIADNNVSNTNIFETNNGIYIFYIDSVLGPCYIKSVDNGVTFGARVNYISNFSGTTQIKQVQSNVNADLIYFIVATGYPETDSNISIYSLYMYTDTDSFYKLDDTDVTASLPINTLSNATIVLTTANPDVVAIEDITVNSSGNPQYLLSFYPNGKNISYLEKNLYYSEWNGTNIVTPYLVHNIDKIMSTSNRSYTPVSSFYPNNSNKIISAKRVGSFTELFAITKDGTDFNYTQLTFHSTRDQWRPIIIGKNTDDDLNILWLEKITYTSNISFNQNLRFLGLLKPVITLDNTLITWYSSTFVNLPYTDIGLEPDKYSIEYDSTAQSAGFVDVVNDNLPSSPIEIDIPVAAPVAIYNANVNVYNSNNGLYSVNYPITIDIQPIDLLSQLVSYYNFDETSGTILFDQHSTNNATNLGANIDQIGIINKAYDFDNSGDKILTPITSTINTGSISTWIYADSYGIVTNYGRIFEKSNELIVNVRNDSLPSRVSVLRYFSTTNGIWESPTGSLLTNQWNHVVVTFDFTIPEVSIYINGVKQTVVESTTPSGSLITNSNNYYIGNNSTGNRTFDGRIDEFGIWTKQLNYGESKFLFNYGNGNSYSNFI